MKITDLQERLTAIQLGTIGYNKYVIRPKRFWQPEGKRVTSYFIDVYTRSGLLIKTKLNHLSMDKTVEFVERIERELSTEDV